MTIGEMVANRQVYGDTLAELGAQDQDIVVLDADLSGSTKTAVFGKKFPDRFFNMGISEADMMGTAAGLALTGKKPFASSFAMFATGRAWEPLRQDIVRPNLNVKVVATHAGPTVGEDGGSHQAMEDIAITRAMPNMTVIVPADGVETRSVLLAVHQYHPGPMYIRLSRAKFPVVLPDDYKFVLGTHVILREGADVTLAACGLMISRALDAADILEKDGIAAEVINCSTIKPFDADTMVASVAKTGAVVTAEEHSIIGGLGGAAAECLMEHKPVPMERVGVPDVFGRSGTWQDLLEYYKLTPEHIVEAAHNVIARKR